MNKTLKRALYGAVYVAIMWFGTSYSEFTFRLLFAILGLLSLYEMYILRKGKSKIIPFLYIIIPFIIVHDIPNNTFWNYGMYITSNQYTLNGDLPLIFKWEDASKVILFIFILTWTFDTFAYLIGVKFGKHKILPSVSPKKSWEGFLGGFCFTIIISYLTYKYFFNFESFKLLLIFSIVLPITATIGDFVESYYKRQAGVKDSGNIIPGHGGILDRMDAFMISIPVIYILINL